MVTAGSGLALDSGLPDLRAPETFWATYPPYKALGLSLSELSNPKWFQTDPGLVWGFYGHLLDLYRKTTPHPGYALLQRWCQGPARGGFVFTSNVDGQFQKAGFDPERLVESQGSLQALQCTRGCGQAVFALTSMTVTVDPQTFRSRPPWPTCPRCNKIARPNILMNNDGQFDGSSVNVQQKRFNEWLLSSPPRALVVLECGAATSIPSVRHLGEQIARQFKGTLVRINQTEAEVPPDMSAISLALAPLEAATAIATHMEG
jgi:NAD-dependent SIR2 family protein deacetylase